MAPFEGPAPHQAAVLAEELPRAEFASILRFIEKTFGLPTLASVNHLFDTGTPVGDNYQAAAPGAIAGPPAPPRDGIESLGDLSECFTF